MEPLMVKIIIPDLFNDDFNHVGFIIARLNYKPIFKPNEYVLIIG